MVGNEKQTKKKLEQSNNNKGKTKQNKIYKESIHYATEAHWRSDKQLV